MCVTVHVFLCVTVDVFLCVTCLLSAPSRFVVLSPCSAQGPRLMSHITKRRIDKYGLWMYCGVSCDVHRQMYVCLCPCTHAVSRHLWMVRSRVMPHVSKRCIDKYGLDVLRCVGSSASTTNVCVPAHVQRVDISGCCARKSCRCVWMLHVRMLQCIVYTHCVYTHCAAVYSVYTQ